MIKLSKLFVFTIPFLFFGCSTSEKYVKLSSKIVPKTVAIRVTGTIEETTLVLKEDRFSVEKATRAVAVRGAGVLISPNNHVLTCAHLFWLKTIDSIEVCDYNNNCVSARPLSKEDSLDLALLQSTFSTPTPYVRLADPRKLRVGQEVLAVGSPLGLKFTVTHGIISALNRDELEVPNMTQSDASLNPGNSGGGLFNMKGELVGINSRIVSPVPFNVFTGLGFSVQTGQIIEFLTRFRKVDAGIPKYSFGYWQSFLSLVGLD